MGWLMLLGKVRISIPVSGDVATVLTVVGLLLTIATIVFFAWAKIKEQGARGWRWLGGWICFLFAGLATALFLGDLGEPGGGYFLFAAAVAGFGATAAWLMHGAQHPRHALVFTALLCVAMLAKLLARRPLNILRNDGELVIFPAPYTDAKVLVIIALIIAFGVGTVWLKRSAASPG